MLVKFETWALFVAVVREGSFLAAGRALGIDPSSLMRRINRLEETLELQLFSREATGLTLTVSGRSLYQRVAPLVEQMRSALELPQEPRFETGLIRLRFDGDAAFALSAEAVARMGARHPGLRWETTIGEDAGHGEPDDASPVVRIRTTARTESEGRIVVRLGGVERLCAASPAYFDRHPPVFSPADLAAAPSALPYADGEIVRRQIREVFRREDEFFPVELRSALCHRLARSAVHAALAGEAIAVGLPAPMLEPHLREGRLLAVLPDWKLPPVALEAAVSARWQASPLVLDLLRTLEESLAENRAS